MPSPSTLANRQGALLAASLLYGVVAGSSMNAQAVRTDAPRVASVNARSPRDTAPARPRLADAAMRGDIAAVRALLASNGGVNTPQGDGMTALHWAAERGDLAMTEALLRAGAKTGATTRIGAHTPMHIASRNGQAAIVSALLKAGSDANALTTAGTTPLHFAAASGSTAAVSALLARKADPNVRESEWGQTPLVFAASANRADVIKALLKAGADPSVKTKTQDLTDMAAREQAAARKRNEAMLAFLPQSVRDSLRAASAAAAAAARAAGGGAPQQRTAATQATRATAATPPGATTTGGAATAASDSASRATAPAAAPAPQGGRETAPSQLLTPAQIQAAIEAGRSALLTPTTGPVTLSADTSDGQVAGFEGTVGAMGGMTALHHAVRQGNAAAVLALLDGGADINQRTVGDSTTPLLMATINGQFDVAMELVKRGADVKLASTAGTTPLYSALNTQWAPRSRFPQPQAVQNQRTTHLELMEAIIKAGADVNVRLKKNLWYFGYNNCGNANCGLEYLDGTTPFWRAAYAVDVEAMRLLKAHGADHTVPSFRAPQARGGRGGGAGGGAGAAGAPGAGRGLATSGAAGAAAPQRGGGGGGGGGGQGGGGAAPQPPADPATDSAARAAVPGIGVYPLHAAAGVGYGNGFAGNSHHHAPEGWLPAVKYLVEELGADVNQRDLTGYTPLHHAAARGDNEMIQYLVSKGADVKAVARNGRTTVDMANGPVQRLRPFPETIALLEKLGAKNSHRCVSC